MGADPDGIHAALAQRGTQLWPALAHFGQVELGDDHRELALQE